MQANSLYRRQTPGILSILTSLTCWMLFLLWILGVYMRSGGSRGPGSSLEM